MNFTKINNNSRLITGLLLVVALFAVSCANSGAVNSGNGTDQTYRSSGVIRSIETKDNTLTLDHEDIPGYMSAMTMTWPVSDAAMLNGLKAGDKVEFEIVRSGPNVTITKCIKVGETSAVNGAEIYAANCAECHGAKGEGEKKGIPLISGHALDHPESDFLEQVRNGEEKKMPAFKEKLSDEQIAAVVKYVRTQLQAGIEHDPKQVHKH